MRDLGELSARGKGINWKDPAQRKAYKDAYNKKYHGDWKRNTPSKDNTFASLEVVAKELGVTKERVRQIEKQALRKLRRAFELRGFTAENARWVSRGESNWDRLQSCGEEK